MSLSKYFPSEFKFIVRNDNIVFGFYKTGSLDSFQYFIFKDNKDHITLINFNYIQGFDQILKMDEIQKQIFTKINEMETD